MQKAEKAFIQTIFLHFFRNRADFDRFSLKT